MSGFDIENLMDVNAEDTNDAECVESSEAGYENDQRPDYSNKTLDQDLLSMVKNISNQIEKVSALPAVLQTHVQTLMVC